MSMEQDMLPIMNRRQHRWCSDGFCVTQEASHVMVAVIEMAANTMGTATLMGEQIDRHLKPRGVIVSNY